MSTALYVTYALLWVLVVFQGLVMLGLVRTVYRANAGPPADVSPAGNGYLVGQPVPEFSAVDVSGTPIGNDDLAGRRSALLFVSPDCTSCAATLDEVEALRWKVDGNVIVVCRGAGPERCRELREMYNLETTPVVVDEDLKVSELFDVHVAPTAVLVGSNGRIETYGQPMKADELAELVAERETAGDGR